MRWHIGCETGVGLGLLREARTLADFSRQSKPSPSGEGLSLSFDDGELPYDEAPADAQELIAELTFRPTVRVGVAYLLLDGIALDPQFHLGAGVEYRPLDFLHLRGGLALVTDGVQFGGGVSFILGPANLSGAVAGQPGGTIFQAGLSFGNQQPRPPVAGTEDSASRRTSPTRMLVP